MKKIFYLFILGSFFNSYAQFGEQQIIGQESGGLRAIVSYDIDGDGDLDVVSVSELGNEFVSVAWYKNLDGIGDFSSQIIISNFNGRPTSLFVTDLDGDGDGDIVTNASSYDQVLWYENLDGFGSFSEENIITTLADAVLYIFASDIDGDGDMDVLSTTFTGNKVAWYENIDGLGTFGVQQIIANNANAASQIITSDIDNDGDQDVIVAIAGIDTIMWYKNLDGLGTFSTGNVIANDMNGVISVHSADVDNDGDMDIIAGAFSGDRVTWYENLDGQGSFSTEHSITTLVDGLRAVYAADLDNDGDIDVLSTSQGPGNNDDNIAWYENDGHGTFGEQQIITTEVFAPRNVYAGDIDGDGYIDVMSASIGDNKRAWYKNLTYLGVESINLQDLLLIPNPTTGAITIQNSKAPIENVTVYNVLGKQVLLLKELKNNQIDLSSLQTGMYLLHVYSQEGVLVKKIIKN